MSLDSPQDTGLHEAAGWGPNRASVGAEDCDELKAEARKHIRDRAQEQEAGI